MELANIPDQQDELKNTNDSWINNQTVLKIFEITHYIEGMLLDSFQAPHMLVDDSLDRYLFLKFNEKYSINKNYLSNKNV